MNITTVLKRPDNHMYPTSLRSWVCAQKSARSLIYKGVLPAPLGG